ncbi:MAG: iron ABC transporter permease [Thermoflexales bacterium]|nr:iron ABC transporter permease [Thermoflexales bacterium]MDW8351320.1 iron ABC transporter permease [Anaerolineae bacterium]
MSDIALRQVIARNARRRRLLWLLVAGAAVLFAASVLLGRYPAPGLIAPSQLGEDELAARLVLNLRLPRLLAALLLGMALSAAGMVFQLLFSNPLVEPGFLGVSQGAAFGAAFAIIYFGGGALLTQTSAAAFALAGLGFSYLLARRLRFGGWVLRLVLAGIAVSALFSAGVGLLKYIADPLTQLPEITFWLLGSLASITWPKLLSVLPGVAVGLFVMLLFRWRLNVLSLKEETAFSLGAAPQRERMLLILAAVVPTAALISISGMVGWIGLIVPHIARRLFDADTRFGLPATMLLGGIFAMLCDDAARTLLAGEIPLGILTSLLGALIFLGLMMAQQFRPRP